MLMNPGNMFRTNATFRNGFRILKRRRDSAYAIAIVMKSTECN